MVRGASNPQPAEWDIHLERGEVMHSSQAKVFRLSVK